MAWAKSPSMPEEIHQTKPNHLGNDLPGEETSSITIAFHLEFAIENIVAICHCGSVVAPAAAVVTFVDDMLFVVVG